MSRKSAPGYWVGVCQSIYRNRSLKLKFTNNMRKKPFSQNVKITVVVTILNQITNKKYLQFCNLLLQKIEEFIWIFFVTTNSFTWNNYFFGIVISYWICDFKFWTDHIWFIVAAFTWLKYCRYGVNHYPINQSNSEVRDFFFKFFITDSKIRYNRC